MVKYRDGLKFGSRMYCHFHNHKEQRIEYVTVEGRNQTLFTLLFLKKKSSKGRKFYFKASIMTKVNFEKNVNKV